MATARGDLYNPKRASQLRDYSGLRYGNITPTDIDGIIEYQNKAYVILEFKHKNSAAISKGQNLCLERLTDDLANTGKPVLCIIAIHDTEYGQKIDAGNTVVQRYRYCGIWHKAPPLLTRDLIQRFWLSLI